MAFLSKHFQNDQILEVIMLAAYTAHRQGKDFNELFGIAASLCKAVDWKYKREWRWVIPDGDREIKVFSRSAPLKAVHLGAKISDAYALDILNIGSETEGQGIYIVFWFGLDLKIQPPPEGATPETPDALRVALEAQLPVELAARTSVVVLDLTDAGAAARARKESGFEEAKAAKKKRRTAAK
ncbi:hypothetical protein [Pseudomonas aylmerensis]|uniref:Uncharacterized protein n=1 Tax=Pseudomonas aylmerensis TaxID=1869229 RepID=A0ABX2YU87_9PSED|nr:hypothetical protein [Pseudomonas aylmerensis]OCW25094.1 hypothetical protein BBG20_16750 [Pseudomonas aylmerensis]